MHLSPENISNISITPPSTAADNTSGDYYLNSPSSAIQNGWTAFALFLVLYVNSLLFICYVKFI